MQLLCLISCTCWVLSVCFLFVNVQDWLLSKGFWLCWGWKTNLATFFFQILNLLAEREQSYVLKQWDAKTQKVGSFLNVVTFWEKYSFGYCMLKLWLLMMLKRCFLFLSFRKLHICRYCLWKWTGRWMGTTAYFVLCKVSLSCERTKRW